MEPPQLGDSYETDLILNGAVRVERGGVGGVITSDLRAIISIDVDTLFVLPTECCVFGSFVQLSGCVTVRLTN